MIKIFTIGFTGKTAEYFFQLLKNSGVKKLVDIRLNNVSQLAGFTKAPNLEYFLKEILNIPYEQNLDFAPSRELFNSYKDKKITWQEYANEFLKLMDMRNIARKTEFSSLHKNCLLCSELTPVHCHRRLLAEYFLKANNDVEIIHLI